MKIKEDLTEKIFGKLLVKSRDYTKIGQERGSFWICVCECGNFKSVSRHSLINHGTRSCGCLQKEKAKARFLPELGAQKNAWLKKYKNRAKKDNCVFEFKDEEFFYLCAQNCYYCDEPPSERNTYVYSRKGGSEIRYKANGIDRVDPKNGYTKTNTVPCCTVCNLMKTDKSQEEFINKALAIAEFFRRKNVTQKS